MATPGRRHLPYPVLSIRVSDGTYRDRNFATNYAWMRGALDSGRLVFGIVYTYCRPNWQANANTVCSMIDANGGLHPRITLMLDVEQGGNPAVTVRTGSTGCTGTWPNTPVAAPASSATAMSAT